MTGRYQSLCDPAGLLSPAVRIRFPAEPPLGGTYTEAEVADILAALESSLDWRVGFHAARETQELEMEFADRMNCAGAVALNGAGTAFDLLWRALGVRSGSEILTSAIGFHGTHMSLLDAGATLRWAEPSDNGGLNVDAASLMREVTPATSLVVVTHMNGVSAPATEIDSVFAAKRIPVVYDAARALGATCGGKMLGEFGVASVFSLQSKKVLTALGEGGIVTSNNLSLLDDLRAMRSFGMDRGWGSNFKMTKLQAVAARTQLGRLPTILEERTSAGRYRDALLDSLSWCITLNRALDGEHGVYSYYSVVLKPEFSRAQRDQVIAILAERYGIGSVVANPPTYLYNDWISCRTERSAPRAEELTDRLVCLSFHPEMSSDDHEYIAGSLAFAIEGRS